MLEQRIQQHFIDSADVKYQSAQALSDPINAAVQALLACVTNGSKVLACGAGLSSAQALQFAMMCVAGFERERPELAAMALTTDTSTLTAVANDYGFDHVFSKQVRALGLPGDVLVAFSTSGNSSSIVEAVRAAQAREMSVLALTGRTGGRVAGLLRVVDVHIAVPHDRTARIQEVHLLTVHCLCDAIDCMLLGVVE